MFEKKLCDGERMLAIIFAMLCCSMPATLRADFIVADGWELIATTNASFGGVLFDGVPLGTFSFDGNTQNVGTTDTIIRRLDDAGIADPAALRVEAFQLRSQTQVPIGLENDFVYLTLSASVQPTGSINIAFTNETGGTFSGAVPFNFDVRRTALDGPILLANASGAFTWTNVTWGEDAPGGALLLTGINHFLKGNGTNDQDFWPGQGPSFEAVPEPALATTTFLSIAGIGVVFLKRRFGRTKKGEPPGSVGSRI
jgi:hypothetical protein